MASIPDPTSIRAHLEGFCSVTTALISDTWITDERDNNVIPYVNSFCKTDISTAKSVTEYYDGNGNTVLVLNRRNITAITGIEIVRGEPFLTRIDLASVDLIPNEGLLKAKKNLNEGLYFTIFPKGDRNLKVTYTYGGTLSSELAMAIKKLVCVSILDNIEGRTGGGDLGVVSFNRVYGNMGKYSNVRKRLANQATAILKRNTTSVVGP